MNYIYDYIDVKLDTKKVVEKIHYENAKLEYKDIIDVLNDFMNIENPDL